MLSLTKNLIIMTYYTMAANVVDFIRIFLLHVTRQQGPLLSNHQLPSEGLDINGSQMNIWSQIQPSHAIQTRNLVAKNLKNGEPPIKDNEPLLFYFTHIQKNLIFIELQFKRLGKS